MLKKVEMKIERTLLTSPVFLRKSLFFNIRLEVESDESFFESVADSKLKIKGNCKTTNFARVFLMTHLREKHP